MYRKMKIDGNAKINSSRWRRLNNGASNGRKCDVMNMSKCNTRFGIYGITISLTVLLASCEEQ
jgi:hypothetical protein